MKEKLMSEAEAIAKAQTALGDLKSALGVIASVNRIDGRNQAANAAMKMQGKAMVLHAEATEELYRHWPSQADGIVTRGGGGR